MADTPKIPTETATLAHGSIPLLGFGTWQLRGDEAQASTAAALEAGYRHLDTALVYRNEVEVGRALAESGVPRDQVFVTTKCPDSRSGRELDTLRESLDDLGLDYVDLWLIHSPPDDEAAVISMWEAFVAARQQGLARDVGVSNFSLEQVDAVTAATEVAPAVNQIRWSPLLFDGAVERGHHERGVVLEGYSALKGGTLDDPTIGEVAERHGVTPAQVIVRWHVQHGAVVIPRSSNAERIRVNADVGGFALHGDEMAAIDALGTP